MQLNENEDGQEIVRGLEPRSCLFLKDAVVLVVVRDLLDVMI